MKKLLFALVTASLISGSGFGVLAQTAFAATFTISASLPTVIVGQAAPIGVTVLNGGGAVSGVIVDTEIYNTSGQRVFQQTFENQTLNSGASQNYTINSWVPGASGTYTLKVGIFTQNWSSLLFWGDNVATLGALAPITLTISPANATLQAGGRQQFTATVTGTNNTGVVWSATNGSIDQNGLYTAPAMAGSATITAASVVNTSRSASAAVTITAPSPAFSVNSTMNPASPSLNQNIAFTFNVSDSGGSINGVIVDAEIYNASGIRVFQQLFQNQNLTTGTTQNYTANWTPNVAGQYTAKLGVFAGDWSKLFYWTDSALVFAVQNTLPPTVSLSAAPTTITLGQTVTLTWSSANAIACNATGDWSGTEATAGSQTLTPATAGTKNYTLACTGAGGNSVSQSAAVAVNVPLPPSPTPTPAPTAFTITASNPGTIAVNQAVSLPLAIRDNGAASSNDIVDVEIYNASGVRSFQQLFNNQNFSQNSTVSYAANWTPTATGNYTLKAGVFAANWSQLLSWNDNAATLSVATVASTPTPPPPPSPTPTPTPTPVSGDPLSGVKFYVDPNSPAAQQIIAWSTTDPVDAAHLKVIAANSVATWFGNWNVNVAQDVKTLVDAAQAQNALPVLVAYNIPQRDCGGFSAGGADNPAGYQAWIRSFASGIGTRKAAVILEPDALAGMDCLSQTDQATRMSLLADATQVLKSLGNTSVYIDAGNSNWISASQMATRLNGADVAAADGFSLNVSNFYTTASNVQYGQAVSSLINNKHFVIDTSRNGNGSNGQWCNPSGMALGAQPTAITGNNLTDALLWIKRPGESDGQCNGGPSAGTWWPQYAVGLAVNAGY